MQPATDTQELELMLSFISSIGISIVERELTAPTFVPGLSLGPNCIYMDKSRMLYPGDLLHEAGHIAVTTAAQRSKIGSSEMPAEWPSAGDEMAAILWSYAALKHIGVKTETVFHPFGYKKDSEWLIQSFREGHYVGLPLLEWMGLTLTAGKAAVVGKLPFPKMLKWMRD